MNVIRPSQPGVAPAARTLTIPAGVPELTLGWEVVKFGLKYLTQPDGPNSGSRWKPTKSQVLFFLWWYSLDENAHWNFNHGVRRLPKGAGKSPSAAVMSILELLAPVRFDHWDDSVPGCAVGKPVGMPLVQIGATAESQALINTFRHVSAFLNKKSRIVREFGLDVGKTLVYAPGGGQLSLITNSAQAAEGALTSACILDQALDLETLLPAPSGWTTVKEVSAGDWLFGRDGKPCRVTDVTPVRYNRECFRVGFKDGHEIIADAGHKWLSTPCANATVATNPRVNTQVRVRTTREMLDGGRTMYVPQWDKPWIRIDFIEPVNSVPVKCIEVDSEDHLFLAGKNWIATHNSESFYESNGGVALARTVERNVGKTKSRVIETCNAWIPGKDSVAEMTFKAWCAQEEGRTRGRARTLYDCRMAPPDTISYKSNKKSDIDISKLLAGVQYAYGDCKWVDPEDIVMNHILDPRSPLDESKRFFLNWPTSAEDAWIIPEEWYALADAGFILPEGADITLGFDGSRTRDATALIGCDIEHGFTFCIDIWETDYAGDEFQPEQIPVDEVDAAVERAFDRWNVLAFFADVREWEGLTKITWPDRYASQLSPDNGGIWAVPGGRDPQPIAWDMRSHTMEFTSAAEMTQKEIEDGNFRQDGDSRFGRHVVNTRRKPNRWGISVSKSSRDSPDKIDATVAMILARHSRRLVLASENYLRKPKKVHSGKVWGL